MNGRLRLISIARRIRRERMSKRDRNDLRFFQALNKPDTELPTFDSEREYAPFPRRQDSKAADLGDSRWTP